MSETIKFKKGLDIKLLGDAEMKKMGPIKSQYYAVKPTDFHGLTPKLTVKVEHEVKAGTPLFFDKYKTKLKFASPVSGKVVAINRGDRRKLLEVVIKADDAIDYEKFESLNLESSERSQIKEYLLKGGVWPFIKQRPYDVIANYEDTPNSIYISCFDTAPLAPNYEFSLKGEEKYFQAAVDVLGKLTDGPVYLGINSENKGNSIFEKIENVEINYFSGKHPAGNAGIQIHRICPINKGDKIWTLRPQDMVIIGRLIVDAKYDARKTVVLSGSESSQSGYYDIISGCSIKDITEGRTKKEVKERLISGNVLTGTKLNQDGFIGYYDTQVTVIPEGDEYEFLGWARPGIDKFSASKTFLSSLLPKKKYRQNANLHGELRAFVVTEQYEKVLPMDVLPVFLLKSILVEDIDKMEQLGIYELAPEDMALCEYVCTSKTEVQEILWQGIDLMIKELGQ